MPKKSPAQKAAETRARRNPLTGGEPNTFTAVQGRELPAPTNVRPWKGDGREASRLRALHTEATKPGGVPDAQIGYRKPEGMSDRHFTWLAGGHHMFPNAGAERGNPAINEPHAHHPEVTVQRRAEDLSGHEYRKGEAVLRHYGHDPKDPVGSLADLHSRTLHRVMAEHAQAGVEESSSHKFYGGRTGTEIPNQPDMDARHYDGVNAAQNRLRQATQSVSSDSGFQSQTAALQPHQRQAAARALMHQAVADTSPNNKWRDGESRWPNIEQAEETVRSGITGAAPRFVGGRIQNNEKSAARTADMLGSQQFETHGFGNAKQAAKTVAFRGALADVDHTDAYKVSDVHEASVIGPGLPTSKSKVYVGGGKSGNTYIHPDAPKSATKGLEQVFVPNNSRTGTLKPKVGLARTEEMLAKGDSYVHALNDHATRRALASNGLSRGVNYSDNVHAAQAAAWGSQQMIRKDVMVSHADQYPVVRDWGHEGLNVPNHGDVLGALSRGEVHNHMGPQFRANPNTTGVSKSPETAHLVNPTKSKPYPVMPGE
jgi:hypothetical protein